MMELEVALDFACGNCGRAVGVTVRCVGKGLGSGSRTVVAAVYVPCPNCGGVNQLYFEPSGRIRDVIPYQRSRQSVEPSVN